MTTTSEEVTNLAQDYETQTTICQGLPDDESFLRMMEVPVHIDNSSSRNEMSNIRVPIGTLEELGAEKVMSEATGDEVPIKRKRKRPGTSSKRKRKSRGKNRPRFAQKGKEVLTFNEFAQPTAPSVKVAQFSRFIGSIAADWRYLPMDKNWVELYKAGNVEVAWELVKDSLEWSDLETLKIMDDIKENVVDKLRECWRAHKCRQKKKWYKPFIGTEVRFTCGNKLVNADQWLALVEIWDKEEAQEVAKTNTENRRQKKMPHTTGTKTYAELRYQWANEHPGEILDQVTFLKVAYTPKQKRGKTKPIHPEAQKKLDEIMELEKNVCNDGGEVTPEVRNELYYKVMGCEKRNRVRGYGVGVKWNDIPGIPKEKSGLAGRLEAMKQVYDEQQAANERKEREMEQKLKESAEREEKLQASVEALNRKMDALQAQQASSSANPLVHMFNAAGVSMDSLDLGRLVTLLKKPEEPGPMCDTSGKLPGGSCCT